jgi:hypothetical protein
VEPEGSLPCSKLQFVFSILSQMKFLHAPIVFLEDPILFYLFVYWHAVAQLVKAQHSKPEGHGFDSR